MAQAGHHQQHEGAGKGSYGGVGPAILLVLAIIALVLWLGFSVEAIIGILSTASG